MTETITPQVTIDAEHRLYVIPHAGGGYTCYGFDNAADELERIAIELVGRGKAVEGFIDAVKVFEKGSLSLWDALMAARESLRKVCEEQGERAVCGLSPQLMGLEGHRVEALTKYGERRRFIVGKSTGWMPCHLEIKRIDSSGGGPAEREYERVIDLGGVR